MGEFCFRNVGVTVWKEVSSKAEGGVCKCYVRPAILYESETLCLKESEMGIFLNDRDIHDESTVWSTAQG